MPGKNRTDENVTAYLFVTLGGNKTPIRSLFFFCLGFDKHLFCPGGAGAAEAAEANRR